MTETRTITWDEFSQGMAALAKVAGRSMDREEADLWWNALKDLRAEAFARAVKKLVVTHDGPWLPRPATIRRLALETDGRMGSAKLIQVFVEHARKFGNERFDDALTVMPSDAAGFFRYMGRAYWCQQCLIDLDGYAQHAMAEAYEQFRERDDDKLLALPDRSTEGGRAVGALLDTLGESVQIRMES